MAAEAAHDAAAAAATYVEDSFYENVALGVRFEGRALVELQYAGSFEFIAGMAATYQWEQSFGEVVVQCGRITGVAGEEFLGISARGGPMDFAFTAVLQFRDGSMVGEYVYFDLEEFCDQAGLDVVVVREVAAELAGTGAPTS